MNIKYYFILVALFGLTLGACSNSDNQSSTPLQNTLSVLGAQAADDEPLAITQQLDNDIQAVFGNADNMTTDVIAGDTVQDVINRAN